MTMGRRDVHTEFFRQDEHDGHDFASHRGRGEHGVFLSLMQKIQSFNHQFTRSYTNIEKNN